MLPKTEIMIIADNNMIQDWYLANICHILQMHGHPLIFDTRFYAAAGMIMHQQNLGTVIANRFFEYFLRTNIAAIQQADK